MFNFLLFYLFILNFPQHLVTGMNKQYSITGNSSTNLKEFSLTEISFLIRILGKVDEDTIDNDEIINILMNLGNEVINNNLKYKEDQIILQIIEKIKAVIKYYGKIYFEEYSTTFEENIKEKNLFIFCHLLAVARTLIKSFIKNNVKNYIKLFNEKSESFNIQLSIFQYVRFFDIFEARANKLLQNEELLSYNLILEEIENNLNEENEHAEYIVKSIDSKFEKNRIEYYAIFMFTFTISSNRNWTVNEREILNEGQCNIYTFYYSPYLSEDKNLRAKVEKYILNPFLIKQIKTRNNDYNQLTETTIMNENIIPLKERKIEIQIDNNGKVDIKDVTGQNVGESSRGRGGRYRDERSHPKDRKGKGHGSNY